MFVDPDAWPPPRERAEPDPPAPRLSRGEERVMLGLIGLLLFAMFVGPLAGSSVVAAVIAAAHAI